MIGDRSPAAPRPLVVAAAVVAVEACLLVLGAVLELVSLSSSRLTMGLTTTAFFLAYAVGLAVCARGLLHLATWSRAPVVLAQLIQLGVAWSFRGGETTLVSVALALLAGVVLVGVFHPASTAALVDDPTADDRSDDRSTGGDQAG